MTWFEHTLRLPRIGRDFGDGPEISNAMIRSWQEAVRCLARVELRGEYGPLVMMFDWSPVVDVLREYAQIEALPWEEAIQEYQSRPRDWNAVEIVCTLEGEVRGKDRIVQRRYSAHHLEAIIYQLFLVLYLSAPGAFDLNGAKLNVNAGEDHNFRASASLFEIAWLNSISAGWPPISRISVPKVWRWFSQLQIGTHQIARNPTERALFALLQVATESSYNPNSLMWLAHALESLFDTPRNGVLEALRSRVFLVHGVPNESKRVRKAINKFYRVRSAFVHGRLPVSHPQENDLLDDRYKDYQTEMMDAHDIAMGLAVATMQVLIRKNWFGLEFEEKARGIGFANSGDGA